MIAGFMTLDGENPYIGGTLSRQQARERPPSQGQYMDEPDFVDYLRNLRTGIRRV